MSSNTKHLGLLKKDPIIDKNETFNIQTMLNENWDKIDNAVEGGFLQSKAYIDEQINLVTATGIPKLVSYPLQVTATEDKQTTFEIPLDTFDVATDTLLVVINRAFLDASQYTVKNGTRDAAGEVVKRTEITLARGVAVGSEISLLVLKNVPIGEEGAINGAVLAVDSVPINRVNGLQDALNNSGVELSSAVDGTRETVAATEKALKVAYDRANEAFQSASDGKTQIATAITGKGVLATGSDTFAQLATKIRQISTGKKVAIGVTTSSASYKVNTYHYPGRGVYKYSATVSGLSFKPSVIIVMSSLVASGSLARPLFSIHWNAFGNVWMSGSSTPTDDSTGLAEITVVDSNFYINNTGFVAPVSNGSTTVSWIAIE